MKLQDDITFVTHKMSAKLWDVAIDDMWEYVWSFIEKEIKEAKQDGREEFKQQVQNLIDNNDDYQMFVWAFENMDKEAERKQKFISSLK